MKSVVVGKRHEMSREQYQLLNTLLSNPLPVGLAAMAANAGAYKAGIYDGLPDRSVLGGPIWFRFGRSEQDPATDYFAKIEAFIMAVTLAIAISGSRTEAGVTAILGSIK